MPDIHIHMHGSDDDRGLSLDDLIDRIEAIESGSEEVDARIDSMRVDVTDLGVDVARIDEEWGEANGYAELARTTADLARGEIEALDEQVSEQVEALDTAIKTIEVQIEALSSTLNEHIARTVGLCHGPNAMTRWEFERSSVVASRGGWDHQCAPLSCWADCPYRQQDGGEW